VDEVRRPALLAGRKAAPGRGHGRPLDADGDRSLRVRRGLVVGPAVLGLVAVSGRGEPLLRWFDNSCLGDPFQSGQYPGWFVPYEIRLKSGEVKKHNLAIRNGNPAKHWLVDGGIGM
jgi:hypothetical protein